MTQKDKVIDFFPSDLNFDAVDKDGKKVAIFLPREFLLQYIDTIIMSREYIVHKDESIFVGKANDKGLEVLINPPLSLTKTIDQNLFEDSKGDEDSIAFCKANNHHERRIAHCKNPNCPGKAS